MVAYVRRASLQNTPEGVLLNLASKNLVFGLSATAHIERVFGNFDIRRLINSLNDVARNRLEGLTESQKPILYVAPMIDTDQINMIRLGDQY